ncbi:hypothetical protein BDL97_06G107100 [Sphagnum fallax]|nr:hypothetical protein BDL97_06G107100 [Sphagnum fallax]
MAAGGQENQYPGVQYGGAFQRRQPQQASGPGDSYYAGGGGGGWQQGYPVAPANPLIVVDAIPLGGDYDTPQGGKGGTRPKEGCCHCRKDPNSLSYCGLGYGWFLFILGFFCLSVPWYVGAFIFLFQNHDYRERCGLKACTISAIVFLSVSSSVYILWSALH